MFIYQISFNMKILIIVAVFARMLTALPESKHEKGILDPSSGSDEDRDKILDEIDLRGTVRKHFGTIAVMQNLEKSSVCSPVSALLPLGKLALGAKSKALKELYQAIGITVESEEADYSDSYHSDYAVVKKHLSTLVAELRNVSKPTLDVASRLYVSNDRTLYKRFEQQATRIFRTAVVKANFSESNALAEKINEWVSSQTHGNISTIVSPHDVSPASSLVIVNAIYFSGKWLESFTEPIAKPFHTREGEKEVLMMTNNRWFFYAFSDKLYAQFVEIPYAETNMSLLLVIPKEKNGLKDLLMQIKNHPEYLAEVVEEMKPQFTLLTMPSFRIESQWDLEPIYEEVGLKSIFHKHKSGLSGIVRKGDLHVSRVIQKAIIDVNHKGNNHFLKLLSIFTRPINVTADRPFLFYVRLYSQQLLMGTFTGDATDKTK